MSSAVLTYSGLLTDDLGVFKAAVNVVEAEEWLLDGPEDLTYKTTAEIGLYTHRSQDRSKAC
jgi:hypothetical protein